MNPTNNTFDILKVKAKPLVRNNQKEWIEGFLYPIHDFYGDWHIMEQTSGWSVSGPRVILPETVCRNTGAFARNNVLVYENDILFAPDEDQYFVVRWSNKSSSFMLDIYEYHNSRICHSVNETYRFDDFYTLKDLTIIGNTVDEPDFIKTGKLSKKATTLIHEAIRSYAEEEELKANSMIPLRRNL